MGRSYSRRRARRSKIHLERRNLVSREQRRVGSLIAFITKVRRGEPRFEFPVPYYLSQSESQ